MWTSQEICHRLGEENGTPNEKTTNSMPIGLFRKNCGFVE